METRSIGPIDGVSLVGLGCNNFGTRIDAGGTRGVLDAALDAGITLFDTADTYGAGRSEEFIGDWLGGRRSEVLIATKFGMPLDDERRGASASYVRSACEASLRRLKTDYIDLYQLHQPDVGVPIEETLGALTELVGAGKVRAIGHSNLSGEQIDEAERVAGEGARFVCAQNQWSLLERDIERDVVPAVERQGLAMLPYYPLASGLLTGKYRTDAQPDPSWRIAKQPEERRAEQLSSERLTTVSELRAFADRQGRTLLELAISWLASHPIVASVIAGATKPEQVHANVHSVTWKLDADELREVDKITDPDRLG